MTWQVNWNFPTKFVEVSKCETLLKRKMLKTRDRPLFPHAFLVVSFQNPADIVMVADFEEYQFVLKLFYTEDQPEAKSGPALKDIGPKFPDSRSSMCVRLAPCFHHRHQSFAHRRTIFWGKYAELAEETLSELNPPRGLRDFR